MRTDWNHLEVSSCLSKKKTLLKKEILENHLGKRENLPMIFLRFLEWKEENQIVVTKLEIFCGQYDSESLYFSPSLKGWIYTDPYSY